MSHCAEHMQDDPVRQAEMLVLYATGTQYEYRKVSHGAGKDMRASYSWRGGPHPDGTVTRHEGCSDLRN